MELWDLFDSERKPLGRTHVRGEAFGEGEYYVCDLVDCEVVEEDGTRVGTLVDVMTTGANDVYIVKTDAGREILLPVIPDCIKAVDVAAKKVTVFLMPGLV